MSGMDTSHTDKSVEIPAASLPRNADGEPALQLESTDEQRAWQSCVLTALASLNRSMPGIVEGSTVDVVRAAITQADEMVAAHRARSCVLSAAVKAAMARREQEAAGDDD